MNTPEIQLVETARLIPYQRNAKTHPKEQVDKIARQISEVGFLVPIIVDKNWVVVAGHGRLKAAEALKLERVPVIQADHLTEDQAMAFRIADNKVAESPWDFQLLAFELGTLERHDVDLTLAGVSMEEARAAIASISGSDAVPSQGSSEKTGAQELGEEQFQEFDHTCPRCGFGFNASPSA